jgi:hypothetical protein
MNKLPEFPVNGGCACGAVRYRLSAPPPFVYTCHCTDCQTLTTSAFTLSAPVKRETVQITKGALKTWVRTTTESGKPTTQHICGKCGVRIFSEPPSAPDRITLRLGTLDDTSWLRPAAAIWMKSAQPWFIPTPDMLTYDKQPPDFVEVFERYRQVMDRDA